MHAILTIPCLMGPTASGKSDLALQIAQHFPCDIISVDSALVYRGMDIGTAKPSLTIRQQMPHYLIDIREPAETYSAAEFRADALEQIAHSLNHGRIPLLVGGTMLYFKALQQGIAALPAADETVRASILAEASDKGWDHLHQRLQAIDPIAASRIHPHDPQRLQRALEVYQLTGKPISYFHQQQVMQASRYQWLNLALIPDRQYLADRITIRFQDMLANGFLDEVQQLVARPDLPQDSPALRLVGYRQAWHYLKGNGEYAKFVEKGIIATRQLAKRQLTWLRNWPGLHTFDPQNAKLLQKVLAIMGPRVL